MKHLNVKHWIRSCGIGLTHTKILIFFWFLETFGIHYLWDASLPLIIMGIGHRHNAQKAPPKFSSDLKWSGKALHTDCSMKIKIMCTPETCTFVPEVSEMLWTPPILWIWPGPAPPLPSCPRHLQRLQFLRAQLLLWHGSFHRKHTTPALWKQRHCSDICKYLEQINLEPRCAPLLLPPLLYSFNTFRKKSAAVLPPCWFWMLCSPLFWWQ